ncbi:MAG TPA: hypothetical protein PKD55_08565 [Bellilinea sp.]|nr:hypothetical protein [Bellilinea sp.]
MPHKVLFIGGSLNQTTMMHQIASKLPGADCFFSPYYADGFVGLATRLQLTNFSVLGGNHRRDTEQYLDKHGLQVDYGGKLHDYDLVYTCSDNILPRNIQKKRVILVQEGMLEAETWVYHLVRALKLPRWFCDTAATGLSDGYDVFCVASPGYRDLFVRKGVNADKVVVTGIPNFDDAQKYRDNTVAARGFALVATSSLRETMKYDDREKFLASVGDLAAGREIIFKLHPNENHPRAIAEIRRYFPSEPILTSGSLHEMIANCDIFIAQTTTAVFTAMQLGKQVYSYHNSEELRKLLPIQNGGRSSERIAEIGRHLLETPLTEVRWNRKKSRILQRKWRLAEKRRLTSPAA